MELKGKRIRSRTNLRDNFSIQEVWEQFWEYRKGYEMFLEKELSPQYQVDISIRQGFAEDGWHRIRLASGDWLKDELVVTDGLERAVAEVSADLYPDFWRRSSKSIFAMAASVVSPAAEEKSDILWLVILLHIQACADITEDGHAFFERQIAALNERCGQMVGCRYEGNGRHLVVDGKKRCITLPCNLANEGAFQIVTLSNPGYFPVQVRLGDSTLVRILFCGESVELLYRGGGYAGFLPRIPAAVKRWKEQGMPSNGEELWSRRCGEHCIRLSPRGVVTVDGMDEHWAKPVTAVEIYSRGCLVASGTGIYLWTFETKTLRLLAETDLPTEEMWVEGDTLWYRTHGSSQVYTLTIPEDGGNEDVFDG